MVQQALYCTVLYCIVRVCFSLESAVNAPKVRSGGLFRRHSTYRFRWFSVVRRCTYFVFNTWLW